MAPVYVLSFRADVHDGRGHEIHAVVQHDGCSDVEVTLPLYGEGRDLAVTMAVDRLAVALAAAATETLDPMRVTRLHEREACARIVRAEAELERERAEQTTAPGRCEHAADRLDHAASAIEARR